MTGLVQFGTVKVGGEGHRDAWKRKIQEQKKNMNVLKKSSNSHHPSVSAGSSGRSGKSC